MRNEFGKAHWIVIRVRMSRRGRDRNVKRWRSVRRWRNVRRRGNGSKQRRKLIKPERLENPAVMALGRTRIGGPGPGEVPRRCQLIRGP